MMDDRYTHKTNDEFEDATCKMAGQEITDGPNRAEPMANVLQTDRAALEVGSREWNVIES